MPTQDTLIIPEPRAAPPMKPPRAESGGPAGRALTALSRHRRLAAGLACVAVLGVAYTVYRWNSDTSGSPVLVAATRGDVENLVTAIGNLQPLNTVDVGAQVSGQLKTLYVKIGDSTHKGDLVAEIDTPVAAAKVDADKAQLQNLRAQLSDKQSARILTTAQAGRQTRLKNDGATSQDAFDIAQSAQKSGAAQVKAVQAQITQAESTLKADQATLGYAKIYAPMTGTVTAIAAKEGQTLNANQQAPNILTISDLATMTVYTQVSEADVPKLRLGMDAYFTTLGNATRRYSGKLRQVLPTPTVVNNVVLYTALFDVGNPDRNLMPQMTAQVFFVLGAAHNVVIVPVAALKYADAAQPGAGRARQPASRGCGTPRPGGAPRSLPSSSPPETGKTAMSWSELPTGSMRKSFRVWPWERRSLPAPRLQPRREPPGQLPRAPPLDAGGFGRGGP